MKETNDWRLQGQEKYLKGATLIFKNYAPYRAGWDHDHCDFCQRKFMKPGNSDTLSEGYATKDNYHWICSECFKDFVDMFKWIVAPDVED
jgi:hypothetical protein